MLYDPVYQSSSLDAGMQTPILARERQRWDEFMELWRQDDSRRSNELGPHRKVVLAVSASSSPSICLNHYHNHHHLPKSFVCLTACIFAPHTHHVRSQESCPFRAAVSCSFLHQSNSPATIPIQNRSSPAFVVPIYSSPHSFIPHLISTETGF